MQDDIAGSYDLYYHFNYYFIQNSSSFSFWLRLLWVKYIRKIKEDEYEGVYTDNSLEENQLEDVPENKVEEQQEKNTPINNEDMHLEEDSPHVQKDDLWLSLLKWLFKK